MLSSRVDSSAVVGIDDSVARIEDETFVGVASTFGIYGVVGLLVVGSVSSR